MVSSLKVYYLKLSLDKTLQKNCESIYIPMNFVTRTFKMYYLSLNDPVLRYMECSLIFFYDSILFIPLCWILQLGIFIKMPHTICLDSYWWLFRRRGSCGVMVKVLDGGIVVSEFVLQLHYYVHFRTNTLGKGINPLILLFFKKDGFGIK